MSFRRRVSWNWLRKLEKAYSIVALVERVRQASPRTRFRPGKAPPGQGDRDAVVDFPVKNKPGSFPGQQYRRFGDSGQTAAI